MPSKGYLDRAPVRVGLLALSLVLLTFSLAPYSQFYLAWFALAPWLLVVATAQSAARAFGWGWLAGAAFFVVNLSWLFRATVPGTIALVCYLGLFWGLSAVLVRVIASRRAGPLAFRSGVAMVVLVAAAWVAVEWLRGVLFTGFPWIPLGQTQSPVVVLCQVADFGSVSAVAFWVVAINAAVAVALLHPRDRAAQLGAATTAATLVLFALAYGAFRLSQDTLYPGPRVLVVQPSFIHERGGRKLVTQEQQVQFHFGTTRDAIQSTPVELVVWSETVMPGLNEEVRTEPNLGAGPFVRSVDAWLREFCAANRTALVTGGYYVGGWQGELGKRRATDIRNAVYVYHPTAAQDPQRYDKIHLVPYGEYIPFERSFPPLYRLVKYFAGYSVTYSINWASPDAMTVFKIEPTAGADGVWKQPTRLVTPICFEDVVPRVIARMFRPRDGSGFKAADMIVNVTNDGWFLGNQQAQHLQSAVFRSIENRVPTARAANTGISGFIDSTGRVDTDAVIPVRTVGTLARRVMLDTRVAPYTRVGDLFAYACAAITVATVAWDLVQRRLRAARRALN